MAQSAGAKTYYRVPLPAITDRDFWAAARAEPRHAALFDAMEARAAETPARPTMPTATDFLAARRHNDRAILDRHWGSRSTLSALALRRCVLGLDAEDPDDRLLDWFWAYLTEPTWAVSAHLPGHDLPASGRPTLDLASCEMAALMAEMREALKPWMDSVSGTLADSVIAEIDARVLGPYGAGIEVGWQSDTRDLNNWLGVCAGAILAACESLAAQGHPRPQARERALQGLRLFLERCFTPDGECDEGLSYWAYGLGGACQGWSRLAWEDFAAHVDRERLRRIADYPRRIHLFGDDFFSGNDATLHYTPAPEFIAWLAAATGSDWLWQWARRSAKREKGERRTVRYFGEAMRALAMPSLDADPAEAATAAPAQSDAPQFLPDQQVAILRAPTPQGELLAALTGGNNAERHNHNDLGHFLVALDGRWIVPDMGAPAYTTDFFGPKRYTYLPASSRGHCCPILGGHEQKAGAEAAGTVLSWTPDGPNPKLVLDLTAAYPPEAGLRAWTRSLERQASARMVIADSFETQAGGQSVTHVLWSLEPPQRAQDVGSGDAIRLRLGPLCCELAPAPQAWQVSEFSGDELRLREFARRTLYRIEAAYSTDPQGRLRLETRFFPAEDINPASPV